MAVLREAKLSKCRLSTCGALLALSMMIVPVHTKKKERGPLCHEEFRALELCLGSDYDRLRTACDGVYVRLKGCLKSDWRYIDDAQGYKRAEGSFNRMKQCRHGVMLFNPLDWYIGRSLEVYGEWGEKKVQIWRKVVKSGQVAVDIGAHVGTLTLPLSDLVGAAGRVFAFEPFYPSYATLAANVGVNSLQNVEVRQAIVSDKVGKVFMNRKSLAFEMHDFFNFGSMNYNSLRVYNTTEDVERPSTDWDEYQVTSLDHMSVSRLDFLKVDAEAMELAVLQGAQRIIKRFKPVIFLEYRNPWEKDTNLLELLRKKMKYECVLLRIPIFNSANHRGHAEDIWGSGRGGGAGESGTKIVSFNLLCKHRWWEYPDMDEEVLELFDTAVDTDIEGLRTTPTADPFEAMKLSRQAAANAPPEPEAAPAVQKKAQQPATRYEEMTLEELLDEGDETFGERSQEISLDELLGADAAPPPAPAKPAKPARSESPPKPSGKKSQKGPSKSAPAPEEVQAKPKPPRNEPAGKRYEDMTLDELLDESWPENEGTKQPQKNKAPLAEEDDLLADLLGSVKESAPPSSRSKEPTLDELLDGLGTMGKGLEKEDLSLDDLLGPDPGEPKDLSLDDLLGPDPGQESERRPEEMSLDELLGPEPSPGKTNNEEKQLIDELLGDPISDPRYEEMSLDELLSLDEPVKPDQPKKNVAGEARSAKVSAKAPAKTSKEGDPKKQNAKSAGKSQPPTDAAEKKSKKRKAKSADRVTKDTVKATADTKSQPHVRVRYEDEITLDEL